MLNKIAAVIFGAMSVIFILIAISWVVLGELTLGVAIEHAPNNPSFEVMQNLFFAAIMGGASYWFWKKDSKEILN